MTTASLGRRIKDGFLRDQERPPVTSSEELPPSYEAITDQWLTEVLCRDTPGARVIGHRLGEPDNGSTNRRRIFLDYNTVGVAAGLPPSVFCKATMDLPNRLLLGHTGAVHCEVTFYNEIRPLLDIETPRVFFSRYDPENFNSLTMLADVAGRAEFCSHHTRITRELAESQVDLLARFHGRFYESPELSTVLSTLLTWPDRFANVERSRAEEFCGKGFRAAEDVIPAGLFAREAEIWPATLRSVALHNHLPHTLNHGDVHLKNWYVVEGRTMGLADWGVACRGHWSRDLAYTIGTALTPEDRRAWEKELVARYLDGLAAAGAPSIPFDEAMRLYRGQYLSSLAFWTVTLTPGPGAPDMQPRDITLEFIRRLSHAIDDLDALAALTE